MQKLSKIDNVRIQRTRFEGARPSAKELRRPAYCSHAQRSVPPVIHLIFSLKASSRSHRKTQEASFTSHQIAYRLKNTARSPQISSSYVVLSPFRRVKQSRCLGYFDRDPCLVCRSVHKHCHFPALSSTFRLPKSWRSVLNLKQPYIFHPVLSARSCLSPPSTEKRCLLFGLSSTRRLPQGAPTQTLPRSV